MVEKLSETLKAAKGAAVVTFSELPTKDEHAIRGTLREKGVRYQVVKKTLLSRALAQVGAHLTLDAAKGGLALATGEDEVGALKALSEFVTKHKGLLTFFGGFFRQGEKLQVLDAKRVATLAALPGREELLSKLVATLAAPLSGFINVIQGPMRNFVSVLRQASRKGS